MDQKEEPSSSSSSSSSEAESSSLSSALPPQLKFGRRTHCEVRIGSRFVPTVIEVGDIEWFNSTPSYFEDVEATVRRLDEEEDILVKCKKNVVEGVAVGTLVRVEYRATAQPAPFTYLVSDGGGSSYARVEYAGYQVEARVFRKKQAR